MSLLRSFLRDRPLLALLLLAAALGMKALVPAGFMLETADRAISVEICGEQGTGLALTESRAVVQAIAAKLPAPGEHKGHGGTDTACPYATLAMAALGGVDAPLLAIALAFAMAMAFLPMAGPAVPRAARLRPPLRGPPRFRFGA